MALLPTSTLQFIDDYRESIDSYRGAAIEAREVVARLLSGHVPILQIESRAKDPLSLLDKLRRKGYPNPEDEVKDLIGVRVITQYPNDAEVGAQLLKPSLDVDSQESYDRLEELDPKVFDYRSIHLVARLTDSDASMAKALSQRWFEIQLRSLLQHAWAEVDHEIKYKSGVDFPRHLERRFAAIAGSLETVDQAFVDMRESRKQLIDDYRAAYKRGDDGDQPFDVARLIGCLEVLRPDGPSLREATSILPNSTGHVEKLLNDALGTVGINTRRLLETASTDRKAQRLMKKHAAAIGATPETLSHLAVCLILIWSENQDVLLNQFPELRFDSALGDTLGFEVGWAPGG